MTGIAVTMPGIMRHGRWIDRQERADGPKRHQAGFWKSTKLREVFFDDTAARAEGEQAGVSGVWSDQVGLRRRT